MRRGIIRNRPKLPSSTSLKLYSALSYLHYVQAEKGRPNTTLPLVFGRLPFRISCDKCFEWFSTVPPDKLQDCSLRKAKTARLHSFSKFYSLIIYHSTPYGRSCYYNKEIYHIQRLTSYVFVCTGDRTDKYWVTMLRISCWNKYYLNKILYRWWSLRISSRDCDWAAG